MHDQEAIKAAIAAHDTVEGRAAAGLDVLCDNAQAVADAMHQQLVDYAEIGYQQISQMIKDVRAKADEFGAAVANK